MKTVQLIALASLICFVSAGGVAQSSVGCFCNFCDRSSPVMKNLQAEQAVLCVVKAGAKFKGDRTRFQQIVKCAVEQWKCRDGALNYTISDAFLDLMKQNPQVFFGVMNKEPDVFHEWVRDLGDLSFVNLFSGSTSKLKEKRQSLITFLEHLRLTGREEGLMLQVLDTLRKTTPRAVD